ncbi:nucleoside phosphatase GDA1/CD39 [Anaeromyces robustus]|uniref:Nucleoside phosphatase GDA1/CD39 n=1 Tax=Anaeromyces robustus TaxID=1754192 RepID=A0A1Y1XNQ7_9FUNG|nr:nucleoside phosphatase GDA1/CD39 [Anaeromyces robustus]|eukprot:ORX86954.1 nucleoside phosphatase GDA1/CD39 [Anaeromyces robustus]
MSTYKLILSKRQLDNLSPELKEHLKYGIMIDAGSSGSRIQIYSWIDTNFLMEKINNDEEEKYKDFITSDGLPVIKQGSSTDNFDAQYKIEEGISTYVGRVKEIGPGHVKILMDYAESIIPKNKYADTEVYLYATAGMRLLTKEQQEAILNEIYLYIRDHYRFKLKDKETNIRIITGEEEGLFGWISTNYLEHGFSIDEKTKERETYNFVDMGGASTQIAFELDKKINIKGKTINALDNAKANKSDKNIVSLNINNLYGETFDFNIFVITFLQYGVNETRRRYLEAFLDKMRKEDQNYQKLLKDAKIIEKRYNKRDEVKENKNENENENINTSSKSQSSTSTSTSSTSSSSSSSSPSSSQLSTSAISKNIPEDEIGKIIWEDPCLPINGRQDKIKPLDYVKMFGGAEGKFIENNVIIKGSGKYDECVKSVYPLLNSTLPCTSDSCLFNNIYSPYTTFNDEKFVAIGKYWDVVNVYHQAGLYDYEDFQKSAREFCKTDWPLHLNDYNQGKYPDLRKPYDLALNCFRSAYIENIIHQGYKIPKEDNKAIPFTTIAYINGTEASWALGALIQRISNTIGEFDPNATAATTAASISANFINTCYYLSLYAVIIISLAGVILYRQRKTTPYEINQEEVPLNEIQTHRNGDVDVDIDIDEDDIDIDELNELDIDIDNIDDEELGIEVEDIDEALGNNTTNQEEDETELLQLN